MRTDALGKEGAVELMDIWTLRPSEEKDLKRASDRLRQWLLMYVGMLNVDKRQVDRFSIILSNEELYRAVVSIKTAVNRNCCDNSVNKCACQA